MAPAADSDFYLGWTAQQPPLGNPPEFRPGNVVTANELPSSESLSTAGVDDKQYYANLWVAPDEAAKAVLKGEAPAPVAPVEDVAPVVVDASAEDHTPAPVADLAEVLTEGVGDVEARQAATPEGQA